MDQNSNPKLSKVAAVRTNNYGEIGLSEQEAFDALYLGKIDSLSHVYVDSIDQFNAAVDANVDNLAKLTSLPEFDIDLDQWDQKNQKIWFMPTEYQNIDIVEFLLDQTQNEEQYQRVVAELELFYQYNMIDLLKYVKYLVDVMRQHNIIWGVGRGSSVSSYCLFLLGVHKINSLKFDLDIREFLK